MSEWKEEDPKEPGWYLVTCLSKDPQPAKIVTYAWYNPMSRGKWYIGVPSKMESLVLDVIAYKQKPEPYKKE